MHLECKHVFDSLCRRQMYRPISSVRHSVFDPKFESLIPNQMSFVFLLVRALHDHQLAQYI